MCCLVLPLPCGASEPDEITNACACMCEQVRAVECVAVHRRIASQQPISVFFFKKINKVIMSEVVQGEHREGRRGGKKEKKRVGVTISVHQNDQNT